MSYIEQVIGIIIYSFLYSYHNHPSIIIIYFLLLLSLYIFYKKNNNISNSIPVMISLLRTGGTHNKKDINKQMKRYNELSKRPNILPVLVPLLITGLIAYVILNSLVFFAVITSGSMSPTLETKDLVLMQTINTNPLQEDIIMFETKEAKMPVIHRIYSISNDEIKTKGDASQTVDNWVLNKEQIQGKAVQFQGSPIIVKNIGDYLLFDEKNIKITEYGSEMHRISQIIKGIKNLGLMIFILCILLYIFTTLTPLGSK